MVDVFSYELHLLCLKVGCAFMILDINDNVH